LIISTKPITTSIQSRTLSLPVGNEIKSITPVSNSDWNQNLRTTKIKLKNSQPNLEKFQTERLKEKNAENNSAIKGITNKGFYLSIDEITKENEINNVYDENENVEYLADFRDCLVIQIEDENELIKLKNTMINTNLSNKYTENLSEKF